MRNADTVVAIATAPGRAGIGVVRVSGSKVREISVAIVRRALRPRRATLCDFVDARANVLDRGIAVFYPAPNSYTGEDVLELQGHGGLAVLQLVMRRCLELGARPAQPGEFTQRAFLNDKLDLAQAESVADLIEASSEAAARSALRSLTGEFSGRVHELTRSLVDLRMLIEATLDFPEEGIDFLARANVPQKLQAIRDGVASLLERAAQGRLLREGISVVIIGRPNVGKSSLMNRLAQQELAIVTDVPGTTRDTLRHEILMEGVPIHLVDTAGLRETADVVESLGIERTWHEARGAAIALVLVDAGEGITDADRQILSTLPESTNKIIIFNKIDITGDQPARADSAQGPTVRLSVRTGAGLDLLQAAILDAAGWRPADENLFSARERHLQALREAAVALEMAALEDSPELIAEGLRIAQQALGRITGEFSADDLLGEIFSRFCIGK
ncbi:MAG TPA: tRNA uridine-5-carboxymethylaminomethyl(34) synthesis GTPase MnmE [Burkholderiales bacterium]|nr:tRNA uridine-5-carboxymethylaminomethyl(34) synthesis GTPase MnmE [Burkholderiales bacterium]